MCRTIFQGRKVRQLLPTTEEILNFFIITMERERVLNTILRCPFGMNLNMMKMK
jgi:hypothetical protein